MAARGRRRAGAAIDDRYDDQADRVACEWHRGNQVHHLAMDKNEFVRACKGNQTIDQFTWLTFATTNIMVIVEFDQQFHSNDKRIVDAETVD